MARGRKRATEPAAEKHTDNGLGREIERKLWAAADKLRGSMDAAEYKHVVLGLIFLKHISDGFEVLLGERDQGADPRWDENGLRAANTWAESRRCRRRRSTMRAC